MAQTPSRRGLLSAAALLPLSALPAVGAKPIEDPVLQLCRAYRVADAASVEADARHSAGRRRFVARHGETMDDYSRLAAWEGDPEYPELKRLLSECNDLGDLAGDYLFQILETPATTIDGLVAKLWVAHHVQEPVSDRMSAAEELAATTIQDAVRLLPAPGMEVRP